MVKDNRENSQNSLYNSGFTPPEILKAVYGKGLGGNMVDLTQQRNAQIIASFDCAQDSAVLLNYSALNNELFFIRSFLSLFLRTKEKETNQRKRKQRISKQSLMYLTSKFSNRFA